MNPPRALVATNAADSNVVALDEAALAALRASLRGDVLLPGDADYETARLVWNGMIDKHPGLIARCAEGTTTVGLGKGPAGTRSALARQRSAFLCA